MDHYKTLGVPRTASQAEIKTAYRKLASKNHPDRSGDAAHMAAINDAYRVLGDPEKRQQYDLYGEELDSPEKLLNDTMIQLFSTYLDQDAEADVDIIKTLKAKVRSDVGALRQQMVEIRRRMARFERDRKRIQGPSLFSEMIADRIRHCKELLEQGTMKMELSEKVLVELGKYADTADLVERTRPRTPDMKFITLTIEDLLRKQL